MIVIRAILKCGSFWCNNQTEVNVSLTTDNRDIPSYDIEEYPADWGCAHYTDHAKDKHRCPVCKPK